MNIERHLHTNPTDGSMSKRKKRLSPKKRSQRRRLQRKVSFTITFGARVIKFIRFACSVMERIGSIYTAIIALGVIYKWLESESLMNSIFGIIFCIVLGVCAYVNMRR